MAEALQTLNSEVSLTTVGDGEEALAYLHREGDYHEARKPDLILVDLTLPKMDGHQFLKEVNKNTQLREIPTIVLSSSESPEDIRRAYWENANSFITKPKDFESLVETLNSILHYWLTVVSPSISESSLTGRGVEEAATPDSWQEGQQLRDFRVLVIEDDPTDVVLLEEILETSELANFMVFSVDRVAKLQECLSRQTFEVIITDLGLPDSKGLNTYREVRDIAPNLPVIVVTGNDDEVIGFQALSEGAQDYLVKGQLTGGTLARSIRYATDKKKIENQLKYAQRMEAIGRLAGGISHDFNNLLTVIQVHTEQLSALGLSDELLAHSQNEILTAVDQAASLAGQLLTFSRRKKIQLAPVELNEIVRRFQQTADRIVGDKIQVESHCSGESMTILADSSVLEQVLLNLVLNAKDAMPNGGLISFRTSIHRREKGELFGNSCIEFARLEIEDTGSGIPSTDLPRVFEPYFTTKDVGRGTGLGLATVYSVIQQHQGSVSINSELGKGTRFDISFPIPKLTVTSDTTQLSSAANSSKDRPTILLVEDETALRRVIRKCLERHDYEVLEAASGNEGLALFEKSCDDIDLLLTDLKMPDGLDGHGLSRELRKTRPELPVIYISGYSSEFSSQTLQLKRGVNFLPKPFGIEALEAIVKAKLPTARLGPSDG